MTLTKQEFGRMLMKKLQTTSNVVVLSRWAYQLYFDNMRNLEPGLEDILLTLNHMEDGPEFEYSVEELRDMARTMIGDGR